MNEILNSEFVLEALACLFWLVVLVIALGLAEIAVNLVENIVRNVKKIGRN